MKVKAKDIVPDPWWVDQKNRCVKSRDRAMTQVEKNLWSEAIIVYKHLSLCQKKHHINFRDGKAICRWGSEKSWLESAL